MTAKYETKDRKLDLFWTASNRQSLVCMGLIESKTASFCLQFFDDVILKAIRCKYKNKKKGDALNLMYRLFKINVVLMRRIDHNKSYIHGKVA